MQLDLCVDIPRDVSCKSRSALTSLWSPSFLATLLQAMLCVHLTLLKINNSQQLFNPCVTRPSQSIFGPNDIYYIDKCLNKTFSRDLTCPW